MAESTQGAGEVLDAFTTSLVTLCSLLRKGTNVRQANVAKGMFWEMEVLLFCFTKALSRVQA